MTYRSSSSGVRPLLRVVTADRELVLGADALPAGDHRIVLQRADRAEISATAAMDLIEAVTLVIAPNDLANAGPKIGIGTESARLVWSEDPMFDIDIRWQASKEPAQAARERLRLVFDLIATLERGTSRVVLGDIPWLEEAARARRPKPVIPIITSNEHGRLVVRFLIHPGPGWYKLYDSGVLERRDGDTADDKAPSAIGRIPAEKVGPIAELAMTPLTFNGDDVYFEWEVYDADGKRIAAHHCIVNADMGGPGAPLIQELGRLTYVCRPGP